MKKEVNQELASKYNIDQFKNKYELVAEDILKNVGENNFKNPYHCMTRFRINIFDKSRVNIENLKKIPLVKGVVWNGDELQIIIGGEVSKVLDEFKKILLKPKEDIKSDDLISSKNSALKQSTLWQKIMSVMIGVMQPAMPIIICAGMFSALYAILAQTGAVQTEFKNELGETIALGDLSQIQNVNMLSALMFVLSKVILGATGFFFLYNTVKYFNGNTIFAMAVGLIMLSRGFIAPGIGIDDIKEASAGDWINYGGKSGFLLFNLGNIPIVVGGYEGSVLPYFAAAFLVIFLDKWIKKWMPSVLDIVFRALILILITMTITWFVFGPFMGLVEYGIQQVVLQLAKIPLGIGEAIFALLWQPLVITGTHNAVMLPIQLTTIMQDPSISSTIVASHVCAVFSQLGAVIAVAIVTKNYTLKQAAIGTIPAGLFGITEPIVYGVNLPKVRPFLLACTGAFVGGMLTGLLKIDADQAAGMGVLAIFFFSDGPLEMGLAVLTWVVSLGSALLLVLFFYKERADEKSQFIKSIKKLAKMLTLKKEDKKEISKELNESFKDILNSLKDKKNDYKKFEQYISKISKFESELVKIEDKETQIKGKKFSKLNSLRNKLLKEKIKNREILEQKFNLLRQEYVDFSLVEQKNKVTNLKEEYIKENNEFVSQLDEFKQKINKQCDAIVDSKLKEDNKNIKNSLWNSIYSIEIGYGVLESRV